MQVQVIERNTTDAYIAVDELFNRRQERGTLLPFRVETLHQTVKEIHEALDPQDIDRPLKEGFFRYANGLASYALRNADGSWAPPHSFTRSALSQMGYRVLGGGGTKYLDGLRQDGEHGRKLAEVNWNYSLQGEDKPALLRTVQLPGQRHRTIRAVLSGGGRGYSVVDNIDLLEMFLAAPELRDLPVIEAKVTADLMRIRFLLNPADAALFDPTTGRIRNPTGSHNTALDLPIPMGELWNGEIGNAAVRFQYGTYFVRCLNGLGGYGGDGASWRWNHTGGDERGQRIQEGLAGAIQSARIAANGQVEDYKAATEIAIDNAFDLLDAWGTDLTDEQRHRSKDAMQDETSWPGKRLASLIDGITLAAQAETDPIKQRDMEAFAARLLQKGLEAGRKGGGRIAVAA
jgi:hypothetical protein